jgi:hypothetical protein
MDAERIYEIAAEMRNRAWDMQTVEFRDWEPAEDAAPRGAPLYWYLQGKAEAYAAIMSEIEYSGSLVTR